MTRTRAHRSGMTLIEIMIALAIIGLILAILPASLSRVRKADLRSDAGRVAAALRSAYDRAAATATHHRLVIDLEEDSFHVERCEGPVKMIRSLDEAQAEEQMAILAQAARPPDTGAIIPGMLTAASAQAPDPNAAPGVPPPTAGSDVGSSAAAMPCAPVKGAAGKPQPLTRKASVSFKQVYVAHLEDPAAEGKVTINFFPMGRGERAVVILTDDRDNVFSVRLHALTGRVDIKSGEYRRPDEVVSGEGEGAVPQP
jgi:prepilin-type N-terminal cleavage/methylation domain-containing protein